MKAMRAIIFKELRENTKWLIFLALAVAVALAFGANGSINRGMSIVGNEFQTATIVSFSIAGVIIGLLQIYQDEKTHRAAFIAHRPISLMKVFAAKVIAGLTIYFAAVAVPLLLVLVAVNSPGRMNQPFDWHMTLPAVSDIIGGVLCYFTGILIAARPARWIGTRAIPLVFTFFVLAAAFALSLNFWYSLLFIGSGILIMTPAAMAAFISRGRYERPMWLFRMLQVICIGVGIGAGLGVGLTIAGETLHSLFYSHADQYGRARVYELDRTGQTIIVTYEHGEISEVTDLNGKPLPTQTGIDARDGVGNIVSHAFLASRAPWDQHQSYDDRLRFSRFRDPETHLLQLTGYSTGTNWFYVAGRRTIEGMDVTTGQLRGSYGPNGFVPPDQLLQPFPDPIEVVSSNTRGSVVLIVSPSALRELNFDDRTLKRLFVAPPDDPILSASEFSFWRGTDGEQAAPSDIAVRTESAIHVLDGTTERFHLPVEHLHHQALIDMVYLPAGGFVLRYSAPQHDDQVRVTLTATGAVIVSQLLPPLIQPPYEARPGQWLHSLELPAIPPTLLATILLIRRQAISTWLLLELAIAIASALANFWITWRYQFGRRAEITWSLLGLVFGIPAVLTLLAMRNFPARVRCSKCGKHRLVNQEKCQHCGNPFDRPATEGIEIFEAETVEASYSLV